MKNTKPVKSRPAAASALRTRLARIAGGLANLPATSILNSSPDELAAAQRQVQALRRDIGVVHRHINKLSKDITTESRRRSHVPTPDPPTPETNAGGNRSCTGLYAGEVTFGVAQMNERLVPTIYDMLDDFPECGELGYCKTPVGDDVTCGIDHEKMNSHTIHALDGFQSAAVSLQGWGGREELQGLVCSVFIAAGEEASPVAEFQFKDMRTGEAEADAVEPDGRALFCSTVESAAERWDRPYLVIPTELTPEWRQSAGLPAASYLDCGQQLSRTAGRIPGIHTPYEYISSDTCTATGMHVEDAWLGSINVVLAGAPKVWLIVPPQFQKALEMQVQNHLADKAHPARKCSQSVRHMDALLSPTLLDSWDIPYEIVVCKAGEMVVTLPGTYHQVVNAGPNYAQAINFAMPGWTGPPSGYRFCGKACPQSDAPGPENFRVLEQDPSIEGSNDGNTDGKKGEGEEGEGDGDGDGKKKENEDEEGGGKDGEAGNDEDDSEVRTKEPLDKTNQDKDEAEKKGQEETNDPDRGGHTDEMQRPNQCGLDNSQGEDGADVLPGALLDQIIPFNQETLSKHMTKELGVPRKRSLPLAGKDAEAGEDYEDDYDNSPVEKSANNNSGPLQIVSKSDFDLWSDCVSRAAEKAGFNVQGIVQAFYNAPENEPIDKVLRTLQCLCEIANGPLVLQLKGRLLPDSTAMANLNKPPASDDAEDVQRMVRLHQDIGQLRAVSWAAEYYLVLQQLQYYEYFEALVQKNRARATKERDKRRNEKKRRANTGAPVVLESPALSTVTIKARVKKEIISCMKGYGISEKVARHDLEKYLKRGKKLHLLLGSASQSLLALFPLYGTDEKPPSLDLLEHNPPRDISEGTTLNLRRPIESSCLFTLNVGLATYFGEQLFVARPEFKHHWGDNKNIHTSFSALALMKSEDDKLASMNPSDIAKLFEPIQCPVSPVTAELPR